VLFFYFNPFAKNITNELLRNISQIWTSEQGKSLPGALCVLNGVKDLAPLVST
jgi:hypothetical protein